MANNSASLKRRQMLRLAGAGLLAGGAGCSSNTQDGGGGTTPGETTETTTVGEGTTETTTAGEGTTTDENESTGDGHAGSHGMSLDGPSSSATVAMATADDGSHFKPHIAWVESGGSVTWELKSGAHTTTAYADETGNPQRIPDGASSWDSGTLSESGATFEHTFETPGVYDYLCVPHEATGMVGTVIVGSPEADGQPGLQPPQDALPAEAADKIQSLNHRVADALGGSSDGTDNGSTHNDSGHGH